MDLKEKVDIIKRANELEEQYVRDLDEQAVRKQVLKSLEDVATPSFIAEVVRTYAKKQIEGNYALRAYFPVPPIEEITENEDGSVTFFQEGRIEWVVGRPDVPAMQHTYVFRGGLIDQELAPEDMILRRA